MNMSNKDKYINAFIEALGGEAVQINSELKY